MVVARGRVDDGPEVISDDSDSEADLPPITDEVGKEYSSAKAPFPAEFREARWKLASFCGKEKETAIAGIALAQLHLGSGGYEEALKLLEKAWGMLVSLEDYDEKAEEQAEVLRLLVKAHIANECPETALELACGQLEAFAESGMLKAEAVARLCLSDVHAAMERPRAAVRAAEQALELFRLLQDKPMVAQALRLVASLSLKVGGLSFTKRALHAAKEALAVFKRVGHASDAAAMLLIMSNGHQARHAPMEAIDFAQRSVDMAQNAGDRQGEAAALREAAYLFIAGRQELDVALQAAMQAVQLCRDAGDPLGEIASWQVVAGVHRGRGSPREALEALQTALPLAREIRERRLIKTLLEIIVQIKIDTGHVEEALETMQEEVMLARDGGDARRELAAVQKVVDLQLSLGLQEAAFETADEALLLEAPGHPKVQAWSLQLLAEVHSAMKHYEEAVDVASMARSSFQSMGSIKEAAEVLQMMAGLHASVGNDHEELKVREELRNAYSKAGWGDEEAMAQLAIAEFVLRTDGPQQAAAAAMDAVLMYRGIHDDAGEAAATMFFARMQATNGVPEEAFESMMTARRLFRTAGDVEGEAAALLTAAELRTVGGSRTETTQGESMRLAVEARQVCQAAGAIQWEAKALEAISAMDMTTLETASKMGRVSKDEALLGALDTNRALADILQVLGDSAELVAVFDRLTSLHLMQGDGVSALHAAEQARGLAVELGAADKCGAAALALAEAHLFNGDGKQARVAAEEAASLLRQTKDKVRLLRAIRIGDAAKELAQRPRAAAANSPAAPAAPAEPPRMKAKDPTPKSAAKGAAALACPGKPPESTKIDYEELARQLKDIVAKFQEKHSQQAETRSGCPKRPTA